jgi:hypothetical protein
MSFSHSSPGVVSLLSPAFSKSEIERWIEREEGWMEGRKLTKD